MEADILAGEQLLRVRLGILIGAEQLDALALPAVGDGADQRRDLIARRVKVRFP